MLGRNNSGKTNLLRLIAGLDTRAEGDVLLDGQHLKPLGTGDRPVGYVFQAFVNYPHWSVRKNIESPMRARTPRSSRAQRETRVMRIAQALQLADLLDRTPAELSGGQQQRLAIGRALASEARVLLLDEPFVNLDFRLRERLTQELGELLRIAGTTVIFASSDCRDAFALADSLVLLADQKVLQSGSPLDLYRQPASLEAAHLLSEPGVNWLLKDATTPAVVQIVRPEHMKLGLADLGELELNACAQRFQLQVDAVETSGSHTFVQGELINYGSSQVSPRWVARLDGLPDLKPYLLPLPEASDSESATLEFFVDPRNLLEVDSSGLPVHPSSACCSAVTEAKDGAT